jgi:Flp pilus assembly protein protease CpaA
LLIGILIPLVWLIGAAYLDMKGVGEISARYLDTGALAASIYFTYEITNSAIVGWPQLRTIWSLATLVGLMIAVILWFTKLTGRADAIAAAVIALTAGTPILLPTMLLSLLLGAITTIAITRIITTNDENSKLNKKAKAYRNFHFLKRLIIRATCLTFTDRVQEVARKLHLRSTKFTLDLEAPDLFYVRQGDICTLSFPYLPWMAVAFILTIAFPQIQQLFGPAQIQPIIQTIQQLLD